MGVLFLRAGNATRLCDANGRWTGSEPKCQPIACGDPVTFPHTTVALINGSTSWKARAQYSCIFGYQPLNAGKLKRILMLSHCLEFTRENIQTPCFWILHAGMHWLFICILNTCVKRNRVKNSRSAEQKCNAISVTVNVNSVTNHTPTKKYHLFYCNAPFFSSELAGMKGCVDTWQSLRFILAGNSSDSAASTAVESHCLQNGSWTLVDLTCVPNEGLLALNPTSGDKDQNGFLVGLTASSNVHSSVSTPVLLIFVVIITVILGLAFSTLILVARRWYAKMTNFDYSPQHFILATNGTPKIMKDHYQSYGAAVNAEANTYATMPVSYRRSRASNNASMEHLESSNNSKSPISSCGYCYRERLRD